jgi:hypothetical protein
MELYNIFEAWFWQLCAFPIRKKQVEALHKIHGKQPLQNGG